jgi:serine/threonine-protein kinase RsbW
VEDFSTLKVVASLKRSASMECWDDLLSFAHEQISLGIADKNKAFGMKLAIEELLSNIIRANSGVKGEGDSPLASIEVTSFTGTQDESSIFVVRTIDSGLQFDPQFDSVPGEISEVPINERRPGGLGLFLVKSSVDVVHYVHTEGKNIYYLIDTV